ncbi:MAG: hypothetical protein HEP70_11635 [Rhodobiaceae bacterium]|nr:hypothetical protein [Rhodobiaceae bacterium]
MRALTLIVAILTIFVTPSLAEEEAPAREGTMSLKHMHTILERLDGDLQNQNGSWQLTIADVPVVIVTDETNNRMRILIAIRKADTLTEEDLIRIMQANFDSALDARYAIAKGILWSTFIHPLSTLHDRQLIEAIGQTVNLASTYGSSYSSGLLLFGGGDSGAIQQRELIDKLLKQGQPT